MTYSLTINYTKNGFTLTQNTDKGLSLTWSYQGDTPEKIDEMLAQVKLILLEEPNEIPLPDLDATLERPTN